MALPDLRPFAEVETPAVLLDLDRLEENLEWMAELCRSHGTTLRPHVKTHKMIEVAERQRELGAVGLTTAKISEAEVFADAGFEDLFVCYPITGDGKLRRLLDLSRRARVTTVVDSLEIAGGLSDAACSADTDLAVLLKLDVGMHRAGVPVTESDRLAHSVAALPGLRLQGVCIHEGETYGEPDPARRRDLARRRVSELVGVARRLKAEGLTIDTVSCGATPAVADVADIPGLTEMRPGNYAFFDAMQVALGVVPVHRCALSVLTTVVNRKGSRGLADAGAKALALDQGAHGLELLDGYGRVQGRDDVAVVSLSEEHGWLSVAEESSLQVGDRLRIVPNHSCAVVNNFRNVVTVKDGLPVGEWKVAARGCMT